MCWRCTDAPQCPVGRPETGARREPENVTENMCLAVAAAPALPEASALLGAEEISMADSAAAAACKRRCGTEGSVIGAVIGAARQLWRWSGPVPVRSLSLTLSVPAVYEFSAEETHAGCVHPRFPWLTLPVPNRTQTQG